jgi:o-succinylbenzoate synthase
MLRLSHSARARPLSRPAQNVHARWLTRQSTVVTLESGDGNTGRGEAAPLPGFSPDTLEDCTRALDALDTSGVPERLAPGSSLLTELSLASARLPHELPAARAALEGALLELWSRASGVPAWALLSPQNPPPRPRRVAALLMGEPEQALEQALAAAARGIHAFKFKVGRAGGFERELCALIGMRAALGPSATLRLDANRAWPRARARQLLQRCLCVAPEFIEEPSEFMSLTTLAEFGPSPVPIALDETLADLSCEPGMAATLRECGVHALILKPTLLGGVSACCAWAETARAAGAEVIVSHAFEGPLAFAVSATLALSIGSELCAQGLDPAGARLTEAQAPSFMSSEIRAWSAPGFGLLGLA